MKLNIFLHFSCKEVLSQILSIQNLFWVLLAMFFNSQIASLTDFKLFHYQSRISVRLSGGSASAYLEDQRPLIWCTVRILLNSAELSLAIQFAQTLKPSTDTVVIDDDKFGAANFKFNFNKILAPEYPILIIFFIYPT